MDQIDQREPRLLKEDAGQERERGMGEVGGGGAGAAEIPSGVKEIGRFANTEKKDICGV